MGIQKVAFNFMVERGGKLAKSLLCTKPQKAVTNIKGLKYSPLATDTVHFAQNDYLANIRKLGLNEQDSKLLENRLSDSKYMPAGESAKLRQIFNRIVNRPDINLQELKNLFTGGEVKDFGRKFYRNDILHYDYRFKSTLNRLKTAEPKDLEMIKHCNEDDIEIFNIKNALGDFILPDKYLRKLSNLLKNDDINITRRYNDKFDKKVIECYGKNKTYFTYDPETKVLEFIEEDGTKRLKTIRYLNGNETTIKVNPNNEKLGELINETVCLKDAKGNPAQLIKYEKSDVDGIFNVVQRDLKTGKETKLSEAVIDSIGKKIVRQNLVSPKGTKSHVHYEEMPNGNTQYKYTITDNKKGNILLDQIRTRTVLSDSEFICKVNNESYNVKFIGSDKIEILNQKTKQLDTINLKSLLSELTDTEKAEMIAMLKRVPADELLNINKCEIEQLIRGSIKSSSDLLQAGSIVTMPNEFVFLHELGHQKDSVKSCLSRKEKELLREMHKESKHMWDNTKDWHPDLDKSLDAYEIINKLQKAAQKATISTNKDLLKIYKKERVAYIKKFGLDDKRLDYIIKQGSGLGAEGELIAEINALLSTPVSEKHLGTRSYLVAENFPETIAYAKNLLF